MPVNVLYKVFIGNLGGNFDFTIAPCEAVTLLTTLRTLDSTSCKALDSDQTYFLSYGRKRFAS